MAEWGERYQMDSPGAGKWMAEKVSAYDDSSRLFCFSPLGQDLKNIDDPKDKRRRRFVGLDQRDSGGNLLGSFQISVGWTLG